MAMHLKWGIKDPKNVDEYLISMGSSYNLASFLASIALWASSRRANQSANHYTLKWKIFVNWKCTWVKNLKRVGLSPCMSHFGTNDVRPWGSLNIVDKFLPHGSNSLGLPESSICGIVYYYQRLEMWISKGWKLQSRITQIQMECTNPRRILETLRKA